MLRNKLFIILISLLPAIIFFFFSKQNALAYPICFDQSAYDCTSPAGDYSYTDYSCDNSLNGVGCQSNNNSVCGQCNASLKSGWVQGVTDCGFCKNRGETCSETRSTSGPYWWYDCNIQQISGTGATCDPTGKYCCDKYHRYYSCGSLPPTDECDNNNQCANNNTCINPGANDSTCEARYSCNSSTGNCGKTVGGSYANQTTCNNNCALDACDGNGDCSNGNTCINPGANNSTCEARYACSGASCNKTVGGSYTGNTCGGNCVVTTQDLDITAFNFPGGVDTGTSTPTVTIQNIGNTAITANFNVVVDSIQGAGGTTQTWSVTQTVSAGESLSHNYSAMARPSAGNYTALATVDSGGTVSENNENNNTATSAYTTTSPATSSITINVYKDFNGNGANDGSDTVYNSGSTNIVNVVGNGAGNYPTDVNGQKILNNLSAGSSDITLNPPGTYTVTTTNPLNNVTVPGDKTVNFGIRPPGPNCTLLAVSPTTAVHYTGDQRTLTATCVNPSGGTLTYNWNAGTGTVPASSALNNVTWTATAATMGIANETVGVQACDSLTSLCSTSVQATISIVPYYSVSGTVYTDINNNRYQDLDGTEPAYSGTVTITASGNPNPGLPSNYSIANLSAGNYSLALTVPSGYYATYPSPPTHTISLGANCVSGLPAVIPGDPAPPRCVNGSVDQLKFGINNSKPWIQTGGTDVYFPDGINNPIPSTASCTGDGAVMSIPINGAPGVMYSGANDPDFGNGQASALQWQIGGISYPENYTPKSSGIKTAYDYVYGIVKQSGVTPIALGTSECGAGGISNCTLSPSLANGVYIANGNLTLTGATYKFPLPSASNTGDFIILVTGDLNINEKIQVPIGSTVLFSVAGNINIGANVGTATITTYPAIGSADLEGIYSTDKSFIVLGSHVCNATPDLRLNVQGAITTDANNDGVGSFDYSQRDLCDGNLTCPVFYIQIRPDFILNAPPFLQTAPRIWQEVAP